MHRQDEGSGGDTPTDTHSGRRGEEIDGRATSGTWKGETAVLMDAGYFKSDRWPLQLRRLTFCSHNNEEQRRGVYVAGMKYKDKNAQERDTIRKE